MNKTQVKSESKSETQTTIKMLEELRRKSAGIHLDLVDALGRVYARYCEEKNELVKKVLWLIIDMMFLASAVVEHAENDMERAVRDGKLNLVALARSCVGMCHSANFLFYAWRLAKEFGAPKETADDLEKLGKRLNEMYHALNDILKQYGEAYGAR